jgi:hypothetical protein
MFAVEFDQRQKALLVVFSRRFTAADLSGLDDIAEILVEAEGPMSGVFDFSRIEEIDITSQGVASRGRQAQLCPGLRRAIVAPQPEMFALAEVFAQNQGVVGSEPPKVVCTMAEALAWLGLERLHSRPVEVSWLREQIRSLL